ncbi:MAG: indole-3-glycerol phosphate synthase TrpC [Gemmatimonadetes bacterium]|nr:indole-3-glycerol phosphate synthase TrpC [Gemmatimonadota bacterium]
MAIEGGLDRILETKRAEVEGLRPGRAALRRAAEAAAAARPFGAALDRRGEVTVIGEFKRRSPSAGEIAVADPVGVARGYESGGAAAVSVLTDGPWFGGSLADLAAVRAAVSLPVLRKDFVLDELQVWEARAAGADALLLIVRILDAEALQGLVELARELGMAALVEVHDEADMERALKAEAGIIGINNRDLATMRTDAAIAIRLAERVPGDRIAVSESGIRSAEDVARAGEAGLDAVLVGEHLMRSGSAESVAALCGCAKRPRAVIPSWRASAC